jgi:uncharacterized protein YbaA (DUF1428 family)
MSYIDGFVVAVPTANKDKFIDQTRILECWGNDVPDSTLASILRNLAQSTIANVPCATCLEMADQDTQIA